MRGDRMEAACMRPLLLSASIPYAGYFVELPPSCRPYFRHTPTLETLHTFVQLYF